MAATVGRLVATVALFLAAWAVPGSASPDPCTTAATGFPVLKRDVVPDEAAALKIGLAVMEAYFGEKHVAAGKPNKAVRLQLVGQIEFWGVVSDTNPPGVFGGGHPEIALSAKDGRVLQINYSR